MEFIEKFLSEAKQVIDQLNKHHIEKVVDLLAQARKDEGRLFILGVGGSAANASHAVNDFRKIVGIEAYAPTDNVSELTARTNDDGWESIFSRWLGGNMEKNVSPNLVSALQYAKKIGAKITGIVGRDGGYTAKMADAHVIIPTPNPENTTPHAEAFQAVIWHLIVSHPKLKTAQTKWESVK
jgi:D-sedoheptulose 7-phosphate isomerase